MRKTSAHKRLTHGGAGCTGGGAWARNVTVSGLQCDQAHGAASWCRCANRGVCGILPCATQGGELATLLTWPLSIRARRGCARSLIYMAESPLVLDQVEHTRAEAPLPKVCSVQQLHGERVTLAGPAMSNTYLSNIYTCAGDQPGHTLTHTFCIAWGGYGQWTLPPADRAS